MEVAPVHDFQSPLDGGSLTSLQKTVSRYGCCVREANGKYNVTWEVSVTLTISYIWSGPKVEVWVG